MKRGAWILVLLVAGFGCKPASAQLLGGLLASTTQLLTGTLDAQPSGVIVRTNLGLAGLQTVCLLNSCQVVRSLDGSVGQLYLVQSRNGLIPSLLADVLRLVTGILGAEPDQLAVVPPDPQKTTTNYSAPYWLFDNAPASYYGETVWHGYIAQPAVGIIRLGQEQSSFHVTGSGIIADIDTGVDPTHPVLQPVLLPGYDFTRNQPGGNELLDISATNPPPCGTCAAAFVNQHTAAMVDQHTAAMVDGGGYEAFGHGTMVAGVLHLVAPTAKIMPLKSFYADGSGNLSDIIRAVYYAVQNGANVINMSFDMSANSRELQNAINYATNNNVICVASAGNDGAMEVVYPAAYSNVIGVASTNNDDQRSSFSNYGDRVVWVAAPGEGVVTTYPFATYAAGWGTSFSSPMVAATADLAFNELTNLGGSASANTGLQLGSLSLTSSASASARAQKQPQAAAALAHAKWVGWNMGYGRLDVYETISSVNPW